MAASNSNIIHAIQTIGITSASLVAGQFSTKPSISSSLEH